MTKVIYLEKRKEGVPLHEIPIPREKYDQRCRDFMHWLINAIPNDKYCYYSGEFITGELVARLAYKAYEEGSITITQRRQGRVFHYTAQKRRRWEH